MPASPAEAKGESQAGRHPLAIALVHHANQYLITDGYDNRQGLTQITEGYREILELHRRYRVPAHVHASGTLLEALAWHDPEFLDWLGGLVTERTVVLVGGTYSEPPMTTFAADLNRRQLEELLDLYQTLLGCPPETVRICWVPERVWDTGSLGAVLTDETLPNGGYRAVLLDDRLFFPASPGYHGSPRARFDAAGPYPGQGARPDDHQLAVASRAWPIAGAENLAAVPISARLRYCVPPRRARDLDEVDELLAGLPAGEANLVVYADDLEKTAGVGGWEPAPGQYEEFLAWVGERSDRLTPVRLDEWLRDHVQPEPRHIEPGTFYELAQPWRAGEDYRGWWDDPGWSASRHHLATAEAAVRSATEDGADPALLDLAWKHLLASTHESAWQDLTEDRLGRHPAPWARAAASHARACLPIAEAARAFSSAAPVSAAVVTDVDQDGEDEVVLRNPDTVAVVSPRHGGRIVAFFHRTDAGGCLSLGNPTDHWNFQTALNRYMDLPPNHPGGLADVGFEHDAYDVVRRQAGEGYAFVEMANSQDASPLAGTRKAVLLRSPGSVLVACYRLPDAVPALETDAFLSPDYLHLLRHGRRSVAPVGGEWWRGFRAGRATAWVGLVPGEATGWAGPSHPVVGHALGMRIQAQSQHFHVLLGGGPTDDDTCLAAAGSGVEAVHHLAITPG